MSSTTAIQDVKPSLRRYITAMMTELKDGQVALSFTRALSVWMFFFVHIVWILNLVGVLNEQLPKEAYYTMWGLMGMRFGNDVVGKIKGNGNSQADAPAVDAPVADADLPHPPRV
jgi:hypothetical protein